MPNRRGQARPAGRDPGHSGGPTLSARGFGIACALALGLLVRGLGVPAAAAAPPEPAPVAPAVPQKRVEALALAATDRDSLMLEIRRYSKLIGSLRDSLDTERGGIRLSEEQRVRLESSVGEISKVIEAISAELGRMEFEVRDNTISLLDDAGEGIVITIPPNLDEHLSQGFNALSEIILAELPDTVRMDAERKLTWLGKRPARPPKAARRVVQGNIVKVGDDLLVPWGEDVHGDVVVVFGNAEIQGRVDGAVVVVLGSLQLGESAEVTGEVVAVGGRLDRHDGASAGGVTVIDPLRSRRGWTPSVIFGGGLRGFLVSQSLFLLMLCVAMIGAALAPDARFRSIQTALVGAPAAALGIGVLSALVGHLLALILIGVLVLTVIGIPVALLAWLLLLVVGVLGTAVAAAAVGERLCAGLGRTCPSRWLAVAAGMVILHSVSFLGSVIGLMGGGGAAAAVTFAGILLKACAYFFGLGALVSSRFGTVRPAAASAAIDPAA